MPKFLTLRGNGGPVQTTEDPWNWDPFEQLTSARHTMNSLLDSVLRPGASTTATQWGAPELDLFEKDGKYVAEFAMPGMKKDDIEIEVNDNRLTISGKRQEEKSEEKATYHYREVRRGSFSRSISFPQEIDSEQVNAEYNDGILRITVPKMKPAQAKKVAIKG